MGFENKQYVNVASLGCKGELGGIEKLWLGYKDDIDLNAPPTLTECGSLTAPFPLADGASLMSFEPAQTTDLTLDFTGAEADIYTQGYFDFTLEAPFFCIREEFIKWHDALKNSCGMIAYIQPNTCQSPIAVGIEPRYDCDGVYQDQWKCSQQPVTLGTTDWNFGNLDGRQQIIVRLRARMRCLPRFVETTPADLDALVS